MQENIGIFKKMVKVIDHLYFAITKDEEELRKELILEKIKLINEEITFLTLKREEYIKKINNKENEKVIDEVYT